MKVRAITVGISPDFSLNTEKVERAGRFAARVKAECEEIGLSVQTLRLATPPFSSYLHGRTNNEILQYAKDLERCCHQQGFEYCSLGPVTGDEEEKERLLSIVSGIIAETSSVFLSAVLGERDREIQGKETLRIARVILEIASLTDRGFGNLRFAALVHCPPHVPFFPAAYHEGDENSFAFALEAADIVEAVCRHGGRWDEIAQELRKEIERRVFPLQQIGERCESGGFFFRGVDLSPAPGPGPTESIAYAIERMGVGRFGEPGTLAAAGLITSVLKGTTLRTCGYCGLMLPILEDVGLAERNNQGLLNLTNLLAFSAICGTGLDTIPLPGNVSEQHIAAVLADVATLGGKLKKPLSARFLPIPGKKAGDMTEFDFPYFVNTKIMSLP
jgi:uncharacterized protein (UPF0210 family)